MGQSGRPFTALTFCMSVGVWIRRSRYGSLTQQVLISPDCLRLVERTTDFGACQPLRSTLAGCLSLGLLPSMLVRTSHNLDNLKWKPKLWGPVTPTLLPATRFSPMKLLRYDSVLNVLVILVKSVGPAMTPKEI